MAKWGQKKGIVEDTVSWLVDVKKYKLPEQPKELEAFTRLPPDLTKVSNRDLGRHHHALVAMLDHLEFEVSQADMQAVIAKEAFEDIEARLTFASEFSEKWQVQAEIRPKKQYIRVKQAMLQAQAKNKLLEALSKGYKEKASLISREISRRNNVLQNEGRHYNLK